MDDLSVLADGLLQAVNLLANRVAELDARLRMQALSRAAEQH
jgi:hypothetical protein